jgi:hypothetical protein
MFRTHWNQRWLKSQVKIMLTCCFIRNFRRSRRSAALNVQAECLSGTVCVKHTTGCYTKSGVYYVVEWDLQEPAFYVVPVSLNSILVHTVLHSPTPSRTSSINNEYLPSLYTKHNFRNCNVATSCFIFSVNSSGYFCYLKFRSVECSTSSCQPIP